MANGGIVIFDDRCGFCKRSVAVLRFLDSRGVHRYEGSSDTALLDRLGITQEEADRELKFALGGRVHGGYDAIVEALRPLPLTSWVAPVLRLRPLRAVGTKIYRSIAARRRCTDIPTETPPDH